MVGRGREVDVLAIVVDEAVINGDEPSLFSFFRSDSVGESVTASPTAMSDSVHAAGLPRNANTSCTHTP